MRVKQTVAEAMRALRYDADTGDIVRMSRPDRLAGALDSKGYRQIRVAGRLFLAHRLAWFLHYGVWPSAHLDHIDRNPQNNRISNLREVSHRQNHYNRKVSALNTSGHTGVNLRGGKWQARISTPNGRVFLGSFNSAAEAAAAYSAAKRVHQQISSAK